MFKHPFDNSEFCAGSVYFRIKFSRFEPKATSEVLISFPQTSRSGGSKMVSALHKETCIRKTKDRCQGNPFLYGNQDAFAMYQQAMLQRSGVAPRRFDEYYRCYPVAMLPGPERESANHGGKVFLPASALEKLTRLHISYPMLFELINGRKDKKTHAGVLEFIAEEGKIYLPYWVCRGCAYSDVRSN